MECTEEIATKFLDECSNIIYTVEHEAAWKDEDSDPSVKENNRDSDRRHLKVIQVELQCFFHYSGIW